VHPASVQNVDVKTDIRYNVTGLPSFVSVSQSPATGSPFVVPLLTLTFDVSGIRALTAASNSTITIVNPLASNRTTTHIFEAWTGDSRTDPQVTTVTTGATYTRTTISLLSA
jgi:hypothetical protein